MESLTVCRNCLLTQVKDDPRSYERNLMQLRKEAWKKFRTSTGFEPVTSRYRCDALGFKPRWSPEFFFRLLYAIALNCVHNCEDHPSLDFITAVHIWFISYTSLCLLTVLYTGFGGFYVRFWKQLWTAACYCQTLGATLQNYQTVSWLAYNLTLMSTMIKLEYWRYFLFLKSDVR